MPFSVRVDGKWHDLKISRKRGMSHEVTLGDETLGHIHKDTRGHWSAMSYKGLDGRMSEVNYRLMAAYKPDSEHLAGGFRPADVMRTCDGFATQRAAAQYLLRHWGYVPTESYH